MDKFQKGERGPRPGIYYNAVDRKSCKNWKESFIELKEHLTDVWEVVQRKK